MPRSVSQASNGPGDRAGRVLRERQPLAERRVGHHQRAADHVGMAAEVLGGRVDHHVGAERERVLQVGRGEGVVHHEQRARVGASAARAVMSTMESSGLVGVSTQTTRAGRSRQGLPDGLRVGHRHRLVAHLPGRQDLVEQPVGAAVGVVRDEHVIAGRQTVRSRQSSAAMPEAKASALAPPSSAARHSSSAARVGFAVREYS